MHDTCSYRKEEIREHVDFSSVPNLFSFTHTPEEINYFCKGFNKENVSCKHKHI